jgi:hypothetical protein
MKAYCENCKSLQLARFRLGSDVATGESYEDLCCDVCHFIVATIQDRETSPVKPSQAGLSDEEATAIKDALEALQDLIGEHYGERQSVLSNKGRRASARLRAIIAAINAKQPSQQVNSKEKS